MTELESIRYQILRKQWIVFIYVLVLMRELCSQDMEETADGGSGKTQDIKQSASDWSSEFERQKREIIELWDACHIPLVHRTYFFLLFKGDPSDAVYMEVELRRLSFLKNSIHGVGAVKDDQIFTQASRYSFLIALPACRFQL